MNENLKHLVLFCMYPTVLSFIFWSGGWDAASIAIGMLVSVAVTWLGSVMFDLVWTYLVKQGASHQTKLEARLIPVLRSLYNTLYRPSLPLFFFLILMDFSLHGFFLVLFVSIQMLGLLLLSLLTCVVKIGEKYPGVLSFLALTLLRFFEERTPSHEAADHRALYSVPLSEGYQPYEDGLQKQEVVYSHEGGQHYPYYHKSAASYDQPLSNYPEQMPFQ